MACTSSVAVKSIYGYSKVSVFSAVSHGFQTLFMGCPDLVEGVEGRLVVLEVHGPALFPTEPSQSVRFGRNRVRSHLSHVGGVSLKTGPKWNSKKPAKRTIGYDKIKLHTQTTLNYPTDVSACPIISRI